MLIKFSILWVEDDDRWYKASHIALKRHLEQLGFHLEVNRIADPENTDWTQHFVTTSQYDLMLVDWRIPAPDQVDKPVGGNVIAKIRDHVPYSDIIFYSGDIGLEKEVAEKKLQGVYTSLRANLLQESKELISHLLHKTLHPKIMRGIIVSSLSQIDEMCFKIIKLKYEAEDCDKTKFANDLRDIVLGQANKQLVTKEKTAKKTDDEFIDCLHSTMVLDSFKRASTVVALSKSDLNGSIHARLTELPDTIRKRNWLAHWKHLDETNTEIILAEAGKENYVFDQDEATRMRTKINEAGVILSKYLESISPKTH